MNLTTHQELVEILAQLDFQVEGQSWSLQDQNPDEHIQQMLTSIVQSLKGPFTVDYVRERLWQEFQHSYTYPEYNFPRLFLHGSYEMMSLDQKTRKLVRERVNKIRLQQTLQTVRSRRSQSVLTASVTTPSRSRRKSPRLARSPKTGAKKNRSTCIPRRARDIDAFRSKDATRNKSKSRRRTTQPVIAVARDIIDETPSHQSFISGDLEDIGAHLSSGDISAQQWMHMIHHADQRHDEDISLESHGSPQISSGESISMEDQESMAFELAQYKLWYQETMKDNTNLRKELRQMQSDYAQANGIKEGILNQLRSKTQTVIKQQDQIYGQQDLEPYLAIGKAHNDTPTIRKLLFEYNELKSKLSSVLIFNEARQISAEAVYGRSDDLDFLLRTVFQVSTQNLGDNLEFAPVFTIRECIQALTGAAIKAWVFESTYRSTSMMATPLLQKYRNHIANLCGKEGLYNLDIAAHQAVILDEGSKKELIEPMASRLTRRLLNILRLLLEKQDSHVTIRKLESQLGPILALAMHIRSLSLVSNKEFQLIWPSSGASFDENEMVAENSIDAKAAGLVRLPILPGLRAYVSEKKMVSYQGLKSRVTTSGTQMYMIKAMVIV